MNRKLFLSLLLVVAVAVAAGYFLLSRSRQEVQRFPKWDHDRDTGSWQLINADELLQYGESANPPLVYHLASVDNWVIVPDDQYLVTYRIADYGIFIQLTRPNSTIGFVNSEPMAAETPDEPTLRWFETYSDARGFADSLVVRFEPSGIPIEFNDSGKHAYKSK